MRLEIFSDRICELRGRRAYLLRWARTRSDARGDARDDLFDRRRPEGEAMIRARAGERRQGFDRIETVHTVGALGPAPPSEVARVPQAARSATEEVGIEREDHVGAIEAVLRLDVIAECELRAGAGVLTARRIPLMPLCRGEA